MLIEDMLRTTITGCPIPVSEWHCPRCHGPTSVPGPCDSCWGSCQAARWYEATPEGSDPDGDDPEDEFEDGLPL